MFYVWFERFLFLRPHYYVIYKNNAVEVLTCKKKVYYVSFHHHSAFCFNSNNYKNSHSSVVKVQQGFAYQWIIISRTNLKLYYFLKIYSLKTMLFAVGSYQRTNDGAAEAPTNLNQSSTMFLLLAAFHYFSYKIALCCQCIIRSDFDLFSL